MPLHRFTHADARDGVAALEAAGEAVVSVSGDDGGVYVATEAKAKRRAPKTGTSETR